MIAAMRMAIEEVLPTTTWREAPKSAYASSAAGAVVSTTCGGTPRRFGVGHRLRDDEHSHRQASDYDQAKPGSLLHREPGPAREYLLSRHPPVKLVRVVLRCIYACMRARSASSYWEPRLAGKIAPMSQRKGKKIPMIPSTMCPFRNVNKHTVKRQKM